MADLKQTYINGELHQICYTPDIMGCSGYFYIGDSNNRRLNCIHKHRTKKGAEKCLTKLKEDIYNGTVIPFSSKF